MMTEISSLLKSPEVESERFLDKNEVLKMICFSGTTLDDKVKEGLFPAPTSIFTRNRWRYSEVKEWMDLQWENKKKH